jgi:phage/plasmid-associated DNA primase
MFTNENLSGFLNLVLAKVQEIIKRGITTTDSVERRWLNDASSCHRFINEELERCQSAVLIKAEVYQHYVDFCEQGDYEKEGPRSLTEAMRIHGALTGSQFTINGKRQHCYQGYKFKNTDPVYSDNERNDQKLLVRDET